MQLIYAKALEVGYYTDLKYRVPLLLNLVSRKCVRMLIRKLNLRKIFQNGDSRNLIIRLKYEENFFSIFSWELALQGKRKKRIFRVFSLKKTWHG